MSTCDTSISAAKLISPIELLTVQSKWNFHSQGKLRHSSGLKTSLAALKPPSPKQLQNGNVHSLKLHSSLSASTKHLGVACQSLLLRFKSPFIMALGIEIKCWIAPLMGGCMRLTPETDLWSSFSRYFQQIASGATTISEALCVMKWPLVLTAGMVKISSDCFFSDQRL